MNWIKFFTGAGYLLTLILAMGLISYGITLIFSTFEEKAWKIFFALIILLLVLVAGYQYGIGAIQIGG